MYPNSKYLRESFKFLSKEKRQVTASSLILSIFSWIIPWIFSWNFSCQLQKKEDQKPQQAALKSEGFGQSLISQVTRRRDAQMRNSLAKILVLDKNGMCLELGLYPCIDFIYKSELGGMDAYNASQYQYPTAINAGTAGALERVVLSACIMRAGMDMMNPSRAVIFKNLKLSSDLRLIDDPSIDESIHTLYRRAFTRDATALEIADLRSMYEEIYQEDPIAAGRNWMVLSCFAVLTSLEMAFF